MKALFGLLLALVLSIPGCEALAQITDLNSAINKAGRQRMLSQRMAKAYFQIGQQVEVDRSKKVLDASVALFDRQLVELKNFAPTPEIKDNYLKLEKSWLEYKDLLVGAQPSQDNGRKVLDLSEQVLSLAHQGTVQLEKQSSSAASRLVNVSGRQRMLSQRMAKFYQALNWGVAPASGAAEMDKARKEFLEGLKELESAPSNTQAIKDELALGRQQWIFFENALFNRAGDKKAAALNVATTSERILEVMNNATGMYELLQTKK